MIWYHQAYDLNHCIFRTLSLLDFEEGKQLKVDKAKILSFYLLFPSNLANVRFPKSAIKYRKYFTDINDDYNKVQNPKITFYKLEALHDTAFGALASSGLLDQQKFKNGILFRTDKELSEKLSGQIKFYQQENKQLFELLISKFAELPLTGNNGLKERTNLTDSRYDPK